MNPSINARLPTSITVASNASSGWDNSAVASLTVQTGALPSRTSGFILGCDSGLRADTTGTRRYITKRNENASRTEIVLGLRQLRRVLLSSVQLCRRSVQVDTGGGVSPSHREKPRRSRRRRRTDKYHHRFHPLVTIGRYDEDFLPDDYTASPSREFSAPIRSQWAFWRDIRSGNRSATR